MTLLALAVGGRGIVDPDTPVLCADDEALLRGRAAFETMRVYAGTPFRLDEHLARLAASAERIGLPEVDRGGLAELAALALDHAGVADATLRVYWTAGREGSGRPTSAALVSHIPADLDERRARGARLISLTLGIDTRLRQQSPWLLAGVKSTSYAVNMAAEAEARRRGAEDAVFVSGDGLVLEGPVTNVWWRYGRTLETPSLDLGILAGVTRAEVLLQAAGLGYEVVEGSFPLARLAGAEEAFTSSSVREIMPVIALDGVEYGDGTPGEAALGFQAAIRRAAGV
ncbi:MAG: aminotransferase class IV [Thermoleophilia bacterium]